MLAAVVAMAAGATDYTGTLTVDGTASQATVHVTNSGSNYTVAISNVSSVGNITITAPGTTESGLSTNMRWASTLTSFQTKETQQT